MKKDKSICKKRKETIQNRERVFGALADQAWLVLIWSST